jgi:hypothetical protein
MSHSPRRSRIDLPLAATLMAFAATSLLFDRAAAMDTVGPDTADPFGRALWLYGTKFDPLVAENPLFLRVMSGISAFVFGPLYFALAWGLAKGRNWIRVPAIVWGTAMLYSMVVHVVVELVCETPPPNLPVFFAVYAGYIAAPILLLWRVAPADPFGS